jgi:hypothetical protein
MQILAALFIEGIDLRQVPGPSTRIDLTGVQFSGPAPQPVPVTIEPHLVVMVHCPVGGRSTGALEVVYRRPAGGQQAGEPQAGEQQEGEQIARNVQPLEVEPGKFNYRLVRAELEFEEYETVEAHCRVDLGPVTVVPYTLLPPVP